MEKTFFSSAVSGRLTAIAFLMTATSAASAATDIQVWHALPEYNKVVFEELVRNYNRSQDDVRVNLRAFESEDQLDTALQADSSKPNLFQMGETSGLDDVAQRSYVQPMHALLTKASAGNQRWFLPAANNFMHDTRGRMLALPLMAEIPVMFYNIDAFKRAGLEPTQPQRVWQGLQDQLVTLANNGSRRCPLTSDQPVSINLENLAAVNKQFYAGDNNSRRGFDFDILYVRHLSTMISWVRSELMVKPEFGPQSVDRFQGGECAVLLSNSGNIGRLNAQRGLNYAVTGLPYYPQVTAQPGNPFVSGSGFWASKGKSNDEDKASAQFVNWLASDDVAQKWYESTGYLPLTQAAYAKTEPSYYENLGDWKALVDVYERNPENTTRGFRVNNYHQIRAMFNLTLEDALDGKTPAVAALRVAAEEANKIANARPR
ncbi:extracellular solute-binding protein [Alcaligenaceae bacterium 429]|uniref:extracellular solute-binding protein n=1 Tax=Paenalcaligenes sp. Me52 TaxID=3392038 RepID=UPI0010931FF8|nr:extracellular solute-binding protein [Alcaligenaceae bacterium 429]